jgi:hypothetical protein
MIRSDFGNERRQAMKRTAASYVLILLLAAHFSCGGGGSDGGKVVRKFRVDSSSQVLSRGNVSTDTEISHDGGGSLKIDVNGNKSIPLYRFGLEIDEAFLVYQAALRTENLDGETFLEMRVFFQSKGEFFSRNYQSPLSGTTDWTVKSTEFRLRKDEIPDAIELAIYVSGKGTVWIDDIKVLEKPLQ